MLNIKAMLKESLKFLGAACLFATVACSSNSNSGGSTDTDSVVVIDTSADSTMAKSAHADISATKKDTAGSGTAHFTQSPGKAVQMKLTLDFPKKANQSVAVHFHEHGDCGDMGNGAHGHWNPTKEKHGKWGAAEYHSGDIGNITLDANGKAEITIESERWTIGGDEKTNILNRAIIVHSGVDDYTTQPTGNSGSRIGCGVIMAVN